MMPLDPMLIVSCALLVGLALWLAFELRTSLTKPRGRIWSRAAATVGMLVAAIYAGDYLLLRFRVPNREPLGAVVVHPYYAVPQKDPSKEELIFLDAQTEVCVHSLLPHDGHRPCWYVSRHTQKRIQM